MGRRGRPRPVEAYPSRRGSPVDDTSLRSCVPAARLPAPGRCPPSVNSPRSPVFGSLRGPPALPHNRVVERFAGGAIPQQHRLPLIADAESSQILGVRLGFRQNPFRHDELRLPYFRRIVLHPARLRIILLELLAGGSARASLVVKQNGPRTRGPLI